MKVDVSISGQDLDSKQPRVPATQISMEKTHFMTAIQEESSLADEKALSEPDGGVTVGNDGTEPRSESDMIDFGAEPGEVNFRKPRAVDRFFANQAEGCLLSPIKTRMASETVLLDPTQESLELKLEGSDCFARVEYQPKCVQPNDSTFTLEDDTLGQLIGGATVSKDSPQKDNAPLDGLSRKRLQNQMEPAVFDVPRETKIPHREKETLPEFSVNTKPMFRFSSQTQGPFNPENVSGDEPGDKVTENPANAEAGAGSETPDERPHQECDGDSDSPCKAGNRKATRRAFDKTLDMTLRTSGGTAFAAGLFLAIDEALDPLVGALVPHGRRRRGTNIAVVICIPILLAVYFLLFR